MNDINLDLDDDKTQEIIALCVVLVIQVIVLSATIFFFWRF